MSSAASAIDLAACRAELITSGSLEMSPDRSGDAAVIASLVPGGTAVYVNHLPRHGLEATLPALLKLREAGLEPVPHVAARRVRSREELARFLAETVHQAGVRKLLLIGGDDVDPLGPYADGLAVLRERLLPDSGIRELALPGYPEGHPRIPQAVLDRSLHEKADLARASGLGVSIVTQFSFAPARIVEYCSELARHFADVPVYVGMAGPTDALTLLRFAQRCGVSASLRSLGAMGIGAVRMVVHTDPAEQLTAIAQYRLRHDDCNVVGAHLFSFGAATKSAQWMNSVLTARGATA